MCAFERERDTHSMALKVEEIEIDSVRAKERERERESMCAKERVRWSFGNFFSVSGKTSLDDSAFRNYRRLGGKTFS